MGITNGRLGLLLTCEMQMSNVRFDDKLITDQNAGQVPLLVGALKSPEMVYEFACVTVI